MAMSRDSGEELASSLPNTLKNLLQDIAYNRWQLIEVTEKCADGSVVVRIDEDPFKRDNLIADNTQAANFELILPEYADRDIVVGHLRAQGFDVYPDRDHPGGIACVTTRPKEMSSEIWRYLQKIQAQERYADTADINQELEDCIALARESSASPTPAIERSSFVR